MRGVLRPFFSIRRKQLTKKYKFNNNNMKTLKIKLYTINELSETSKEKVIEHYRHNCLNYDFIYDEAYNTVKEFHEIFPTKEGRRSWLTYLSNYTQEIEDLKGLNLRKWIINNFWSDLYTPKFIGSLKTNEIVKHNRIKSEPLHGNVFNPFYSGVQIDNSCVLTGASCDHYILDPIYQLIEYPENMRDYLQNLDIKTLFDNCFNSLKESIKNEKEAKNQDDYIIEEIEANEYHYTENGEYFDF